MTTMQTDETIVQLLERGLMQQYGPLIANDDLRQALGYPSKEAFRQALVRKNVPVPVFALENRRGKFALSVDVAKWLATQREQASVRGTYSSEVSTAIDEKKGDPMS